MHCSYCDRYHKYQWIMGIRNFVFELHRFRAMAIRVLQKCRTIRPNTAGIPDLAVGAVTIGGFATPFQGGEPVSDVLPCQFGQLQYLVG